jgi:DNA-binding Xre family transcriptional regulator
MHDMRKKLLRAVLPYAYIVPMNIDLHNPQWLAVMMAYRNMTAAELARQAGVSQRAVQMIRDGKSPGSLSTVRELAKALDCEIQAKAA